MASTDVQLSIYNEALRLLGERRLASLSEAREPRRLLDDVWGSNTVDYCLEQGQWVFATRSIEATYETSITPSFGYTFAFEKPEDFIRTAAICTDEYFKNPLLRYSDEAGFWYSDLQTIYVKYVSNDNAYGNDDSLWPETFKRFMAAYMAREVAPRLTASRVTKADMDKEMATSLKDARSKDAMAKPTQMLPIGSWASSRRDGTARRDRGNRGSLIG
jgi:hypothetical protein